MPAMPVNARQCPSMPVDARLPFLTLHPDIPYSRTDRNLPESRCNAMPEFTKFNRREFVRTAVGASVALKAAALTAASKARVIDANDRIALGFIGVGGRGGGLLREALRLQEAT